jgi:HD-GYP domain-containing protein (c-di-GMP phosphodiesterase class II)
MSVLQRVPGFAVVSEIAASHHERLDGGGYFRGTRATTLPLSARILAAAEVYQSLSSKCSYRDALPREQVFRIMHADARTGIDVECVTALEKSLD